MEDLWERLVRAALRGRRAGGDWYGRPEAGFATNVPSSLGNRNIDDILRAADEIQDDDPNISRICMRFSLFSLYFCCFTYFILLSGN